MAAHFAERMRKYLAGVAEILLGLFCLHYIFSSAVVFLALRDSLPEFGSATDARRLWLAVLTY
jgi:hypothetical protein